MRNPYKILHFLYWDISLKVETDLEKIGEKISQKYFFILELWTSKIWKSIWKVFVPEHWNHK